MGFAEKYLKKQSFQEKYISRAPINTELLKYIVIIPAFSEPDIYQTLESLKNTSPTESNVLVLVLVNYSEACSESLKEQNQQLFRDLETWSISNNTTRLCFLPILAADLPAKHAGAGLARKILMDYACTIFDSTDNPEGIILSLDADTLVPQNYFSELALQANKNKKTDCFIFNFAHPLDGNTYSPSVYNAICLYELHLRYYKNILQSISYPYYHYTIGSCFALRAKTYIKVGGMNKRKAGEDFYFLQKVFKVSNTLFANKIILQPSPRPSWRVPFGTGPTIRKITSQTANIYQTYHPSAFKEVKELTKLAPEFYQCNSGKTNALIDSLPTCIKEYLLLNNIHEHLLEINNNSASKEAFTKRFFAWFDAFNLLKFLNYARDNCYGGIDITSAIKQYTGLQRTNNKELLTELRLLEE